MASEGNNGEVKSTDSKFREEIHSNVVRAGKRTYFFDVKSTRNDEYYLTITESKRRFGENGNFSYEKHKIFLYREDFEKFVENLQEVVEFINEKQPHKTTFSEKEKNSEAEKEAVAEAEEPAKDYTDVDFEDI